MLLEDSYISSISTKNSPALPAPVAVFESRAARKGKRICWPWQCSFMYLWEPLGASARPLLPGWGGGWIRSGDPDERIGMVFVNDRKYKCDGDELLGGLVFFCLGGWWWMMDDWRKFWNVSVEPFFSDDLGFMKFLKKEGAPVLVRYNVHTQNKHGKLKKKIGHWFPLQLWAY